MELNSELITIVLAVITALTSTKAWDYWQKKQTLVAEEKKSEKDETHLYRDDLKVEVSRLRTELIGLYGKREDELKNLQKEISELREQLATFKTRVEFLEKENSDLKAKLKE